MVGAHWCRVRQGRSSIDGDDDEQGVVSVHWNVLQRVRWLEDGGWMVFEHLWIVYHCQRWLSDGC